jgi:transposase InsO family protein
MRRRILWRTGNCRDNACEESFFKTLKREVEEFDGGTSCRKVKAAVFEYIEVYYNRKRLHSRNGYKPPAMVAGSVA